ncbi:hypothetical protein FBY34_2027 [Streptomyces sp. SLBN-115]|nr:hypothetical protein FBY34_2027 [Streptomyces sp. SLBN-115]
MEKPEIAGDKGPQPVGCRWTTPCTACGSFFCPQPVEILRPRIHSQVTWSDGPASTAPVDTVWTTSQSPGCGREKVTESVESGRNPAVNRTTGERWTTVGGRGPARVRCRFGPGSASDRPGSARDRPRDSPGSASDRPPRPPRADPAPSPGAGAGQGPAAGSGSSPGAAAVAPRRPAPPRAAPPRAAPPRAAPPRAAPPRAAPRRAAPRNDGGRPRISLRGRPQRRLYGVLRRRQPFLMRLVSSVTWL